VAARERFTVIPLGLELDRFADVERAAARREIRAELGTPAGQRVVAIVGRLVPVKDHDLFLRAFARVVESEAGEVEAWMVGSGQLRGALEATAAELGLADRIRWLGWRRDLDRLLPGADVVALTSRDEGTPVVLLEAIASGTPVAAVDVGGVREILRGAGLEEAVLPAEEGRSADGVARLVRRILHHPRWAGGKGLPDSARGHVRDAYSSARLSADVDRLYTELARARGLIAD
jgi:glycosyltransferase involved in cell wall biosynthesis